MKHLIYLFILVALLSEIILSVNPVAGLVSYFVLITGCLIILARNEKMDDFSKFVILFLIVPTMRMIDVFLNFNQFMRTIIFYYLLLFLVVFYSLKFKINIGYNSHKLILLPIVTLLGLGFGYIANQLMNVNANISMIFILPIIVFSEEILFRGLLQNTSLKIYDKTTSFIFVALLYSIFSLSLGIIFASLLALFSLVLSIIYFKTKNIYLTLIANFIFQSAIFVIPKI